MMDLGKNLFSLKRTHQDMTRLNSFLHGKFSDYMHNHLEWAMDNVPDNAMIQIEIVGDDFFNEWSSQLVKESVEEGQPVFIARFLPADNEQKFVFDPQITDSHHRAMAMQ